MNFDTATLTRPAIALAAPKETHRAVTPAGGITSARALLNARSEVLRGFSTENAFWFVIAIAALVLVAMSFLA